MNLIKKLILLGGGGGQPVYIIRDDFTTAVAAPLAASRASEPGLGTMTKLSDTGNWGLINASQQFEWTGGSGGFTGDPTYRWDAVTRASGRACYFRLVTGAALGIEAIGLSQAATLSSLGSNCAHFFYLTNTTVSMLFNSSANLQLSTTVAYAINTTYELMLWMHTAGALWLIKGGVFTVWTPVWHELITSTATVYPLIVNKDAVHKVKTMRVFDVPPAYAVDFPLATVNVTSPATGVAQTATADGLHEMFFTLPGSPAAGDTVEMRYRVQDASNYWTAYIKRNVGNTAWDFYLDKVTAGTPATQTGFPVTGVGTVDGIQVNVRGNEHNCFTKVTTTWAKRGGPITSASFNSATTINATYAAGTVSRLSSLPMNDAYASVLNPFLAA